MIKMIVEIEEDIYEQIKTHHLPDVVMNACTYAITHGTVLPEKSSEDCVSKQAVIDTIKSMQNANPSYWYSGDMVDREDLIEEINELSSVIPTEKERQS